MKKNLLIAAIVITALASCTSNDYVGDQSPQGSNETNGAISFDMSTPAVTRSTTGSAAADLLNNNFVVFGYKTMGTGGSATTQTVFDNYQVNWVTSTAGKTESNSADWEYVGYTSKATNPVAQTIKYWDLKADSYDFFAYSLGKAVDDDNDNDASTPRINATASVISNSTYTLTGSSATLGACYISKKNHITSLSSAAREVNLDFVNFLSKIQLKFYETIPGYSVKDVKFYIDGSTMSTGAADNDGKKPAIYGAANSIKTGGQYTITFDTEYNPVVEFTSDANYTQDSKVLFDPVTPATTGESPSPAVWLSGYATKEYKETADANPEPAVYLGREANAATSTSQISVIPNSSGVALTLKMDYTLVSRDGTGETIEVEGATATIPAQFTAWKPNYAYTYIFKITDDKLIPITLDAIVTDTQEGGQETITTVSTPSITTYAKASAVTTDNEYKTNSNIYVVVDKNGVQALTVGTSANLYLVTNNTGEGTAQEITEASVANALEHGTATDANNDQNNDTWTVTGAGMKSLIVTTISVPTLSATSSIAADDSPTGIAITVNGAKFTPTAAGTYVFEFIDPADSKKYYKIIKVVA